MDAFNETLADLDMLECADIAARSVDLLLLDADDGAVLSSYVVDDAVSHDFGSPPALHTRDLKFSNHSSFAHSDANRKHHMSKNYGRRRC